MGQRRAVLVVLLFAGWVRGQDLRPGDVLPDCSKIPLVAIGQAYQPQPHDVHSIESMLPRDGVLILHFLTSRPPRGGTFKSYFVEELSALRKAAYTAPYPCTAAAVLPFGEKGREDAVTALSLLKKDEEKPWAGGPALFYEPTFPRPGLYRTFRPGAGDGRPVEVPLTFVIGPGRKILAVRAAGEGGQLYDWLGANLPERVEPAPRSPAGDVSIVPPEDPWTWPAFRRTTRRQAVATVLPNTLPYTYLAWQAEVGRTFASPAVSDQTIFLSTDSNGLCALAIEDGQELGGFELGASWWTSPALAGELVYTIAADGTVHALDHLSLEERWRRPLGALVTSSPMVSGGVFYVGARDGAVYALDALSGEQLWRVQTGGEISSSPALADGALYIGSGDRRLYALETASGKILWSLPTGGPVDSSPAVAGDTVVVGSFDGCLYAANRADGSLLWRTELGGWVHASPAVADGTVFVGTVRIRSDQVPAFFWLDLKTGQKKGEFEVPDSIYSSPTIWEGQVLVGCRDHQLYAFDRAMRQTQPLWTFKTRSYVHASPVVVGDTVLVASFDGILYALRQARPIEVWTPEDVVPRWFMAALAQRLHQETADLIVRAAAGQAGQELSLTGFEDLFKAVRGRVTQPGEAPPVLPADVPSGHPGASFIGYALTAGLLSGYPDGSFRPNDPTSRYQFSAGLSAVLTGVVRPDYVWRALKDRAPAGVAVEVQVRAPAGRRRQMAGDVAESHWAATALRDLAAKGLLPLDDEGRFRGERTVTLADARVQWQLLVDSVKVVRTR